MSSSLPRFRALCGAVCGVSLAAAAADVNLVGTFPGRALVEIDRAPPRVMRIGDVLGSVRLLEADSDSATLEVDGVRRKLRLGQSFAPAARGGHPSATLEADSHGHFITNGQINGAATRFVVDTGATLIALGAGDARRMGIDYRRGQRGVSNTANGPIGVWRVRLDSVRVGDIDLHQVDAEVSEGAPMPFALLGMSFLNRTEMHRDGTRMTLIQRF
jgi:aspartyl protease family protein